jgi:hypothetical protein
VEWPGTQPVIVASRADHLDQLQRGSIDRFVRVRPDHAVARAAAMTPLRLRREKALTRVDGYRRNALRLAVSDEDPRLAVPREPVGVDSIARGLRMVAELARCRPLLPAPARA